LSWARYLPLMLLPAVPLAQMRVDRALGSLRSQEEVLYLWSGDHVKRLCLGFEGVMADIYWLRTVQYFGGQRAFSRSKDFSLLEPLIDITVSLDPRFEIAYRYGAIFLSEPKPLGAGRPEGGCARSSGSSPTCFSLTTRPRPRCCSRPPRYPAHPTG